MTALEYYQKYVRIMTPEGPKEPVISQADLFHFKVIDVAAKLGIQPYIRNYGRRGPSFIVNPHLEEYVKDFFKDEKTGST